MDGRSKTCKAPACQKLLREQKQELKAEYREKLPKDEARHPYKRKKSKNPCIRCGEDKGVNHWYCKRCHGYITDSLGYPEYVGEIIY